MGLLLLFLLLALFFPVLFYPLLFFIGLLLIFIPLKFTVDSFFNLFFIPGQIYKIATNKKLRRNHAVEHATVNVLESEYGYQNLSGYATEEGFYIIGADYKQYVQEASQQGLNLLKEGNSELAIHNHCGTSRIAASLLASILFLILIFYTASFSIINIIIAIILAHFFSPFLGKTLQRRFTTTTDVGELEIDSIYLENGHSFFKRRPGKFFVKTTNIPFL